METSTVLLMLFGLAVKHFLFDYPFQTKTEVVHKGRYGDLKGTTHSLKHGLGTLVVLMIFTNPAMAISMALFDAFTHYHIDWLKVQLTNKVEPNSRKYWTLFGADQLAHTSVYLLIAMKASIILPVMIIAN